MAISEKASFNPTVYLNNKLNGRSEDELNNPSRSVLEIPTVYYKDILNKANLAKKRVWYAGMYFVVGHATGILENTLIKAAQRGVDARLRIDSISDFMLHEGKIFFGRKPKPKDNSHPFEKETTDQIFLNLEASDVLVTKTNPFGRIGELVPIFGRNHGKMTVIDDLVWVGGLNFSDVFFSEGVADYNVRMGRPGVVRAVADHFKKTDENRIARDYSIECDSEYKFLADAGKRGESIIYDGAQKMVDEALPHEEIIFISQHFPDGPLLDKLISRSKKGNPVTIIASHKNKKRIPKNPNSIEFEVKRRISNAENLSVLYYPGHVHAKLLMVGQRKALFGSHNLVTIGIRLGTEEIAIQTTDLDLLGQLSQFVNVIKDASSYPLTSDHLQS